MTTKANVLLNRISESLDRTPRRFNSEELIRDMVYMHTDRDGKVNIAGLQEFFTTLKDNFATAAEVSKRFVEEAKETMEESIHE